MTPVGHLSIAYLSGKLFQSLSLPAVVIGGVLPDSDFLLLWWPGFNGIHRVITHNLFFLSLAALLGGLLAAQGRRRIVTVSLLFGGLLHVLVDACLDNNPSNGIGVSFLWPFSAASYSPFNLLEPAAGGTGWADPKQMIRAALPLALIEAPFIAGAALLYWRRRLAKLRQAPRIFPSGGR